MENKGDYVMIAKGNQEQLRDKIRSVFQTPEPNLITDSYVEQVNNGHGRFEKRLLRTSILFQSQEWPGLKQVFEIKRSTILKKSGTIRNETVYGFTSLCPQKADAKKIMQYNRHHWGIENRSHWVRDVVLDEDRSQVRNGSVPQVMATLRNLTITLMRVNGKNSIKKACRFFAARPQRTLEMIGC